MSCSGPVSNSLFKRGVKSICFAEFKSTLKHLLITLNKESAENIRSLVFVKYFLALERFIYGKLKFGF